MISRETEVTEQEKDIVESLYAGYSSIYGFPQGKCEEIARTIKNSIGGKMVGGILVINHVTHRTHWWVEKNGEIIDPMADELKETDTVRHAHVEDMDFAGFLNKGK